MKKVILAALLGFVVYASVAEARYTNGYYRQSGTYVNGYWGN